MTEESAQSGQVVGGRYEVVREIARGGMGVVYEARHRMTKKSVALKVLFPHIGKDTGARQRFLREVSAPAQIGHPGIVEVYDADFDTSDGSLFVAMELLEGDTFRDWLARGGHTRSEVLDAFEEMLEPLAAAHENGIVHRDLKPENVILAKQRDGSVRLKLLDFGIARDLDSSAENVTHTGIAMGTPHYMAPEQAMSARGVTAAADIWAMGAMLYESLTGRTPFVGETASAIVVHACTAPHPPIASVAPSTPPALAALVDRCLSKTAGERPQDAAALLAELREVRGHANAATKGPGAAFGVTAPSSPAVPTPAAPTAQGGPATAPNPAPAQPGAAGQAPAASTQPAPQAAFGTPQPGFGTGPQPASGAFGQTTPASPINYPTQPNSAGRSNTAWIVGGALVGLLLVAGLGGVAYFLHSRSTQVAGEVPTPTDPNTPLGTPIANPNGTTPNTPGTTPNTPGTAPGTTPGAGAGSIILITNIQGGQLMVDGAPQGPAQHGREVSLSPGPHQVAVSVGGSPVAQQSVTVIANVPAQVQLMANGQPATAPPTGVPNGAPEVRNGTLAQGDSTLNSGEFVDRYNFQWAPGQRYAIDARSSAFDTYIIIKPPSGAQIDNDDRSQSAGTDAGYDLDVSMAGTWQVLVTSFRPGEVGAYTLTVQPVR